MRKVIFIGGTSYSGSTLLDLMLANSDAGFSCGEVCALFYPYRRHHLAYECGCSSQSCAVWPEARRAGPGRLYQTLFEAFPDVEYITDSSKDPLWIQDRTRELRGTNIGVSNILIWKTPQEFLASCAKRGRQVGWRKSWVNYHRLYFRLVNGWRSLRYTDLVSSAAALERLCNVLDIPYFEGKERFWERQYHTLFGNASAKIHLHEKGSPAFNAYQQELDSDIGGCNEPASRYQQIYYTAAHTIATGKVDSWGHVVVSDILAALEASDVTRNGETGSGQGAGTHGLNSSFVFEQYHRAKRRSKTAMVKLRAGAM